MCHLKRFCENPERAGQNEVTEVLARVQKHVDKFHFREAIDQKNWQIQLPTFLKITMFAPFKMAFTQIDTHVKL